MTTNTNTKRVPKFFPLAMQSLAVLCLISQIVGCSDKSSDCRENATCPIGGRAGAGAGLSNAGTAGATTTSLASAGHTIASGGGGGGSLGGTVGAAGTSAGAGVNGLGGAVVGSSAIAFAGAAGSPTRPCGGACTGTTPICNQATNTCVECLDGAQCSVTKPYCYARLGICAPMIAENCTWIPATPVYSKERQTCVECLDHTDCKTTEKSFCKVATNTCVSCFSNQDCTTASKARCDTASNSCVPCNVYSDCTQVERKHVCDAGTCVQCTGAKYSDCGKLDGQALVCDSVNRTCSLDQTEASGDVCTPCISDAQCRAGQLCAEQRFNTEVAGRFCFWREGDTAHGAPSSCASGTARPYVTAVASTSVDGSTVTLCGLQSSTCVAMNQYAKAPCRQAGLPAPSLCGFQPGGDSNCIQDASTKDYLCTVTCTTDNDCPRGGATAGAKCDLYSTPRVCALQ
ncbi:MAG: hypothetical protein ACM3ZE_14295 [Myxococcales bacterium]